MAPTYKAIESPHWGFTHPGVVFGTSEPPHLDRANPFPGLWRAMAHVCTPYHPCSDLRDPQDYGSIWQTSTQT